MRAGGGQRLGVRGEDENCIVLAGSGVEQLADGGGGGGIEVAGWFIAEEQGGGVHQGAGDGDALTLAAGEFAGQVGLAVGKADSVEEFPGAGAVLGTHGADGQPGYQDVFQGRELRQKVVVLKYESDVGGAVVGEGGRGEGEGVDGVEGEGAGGGGVETAEDLQERGFSGAGGAEDGHCALVAGEVEGDVVEHGQGAGGCGIGFGEVLSEEVVGHGVLLATSGRGAGH